MSYLGDYAAGDTIDFKFTTRQSTGVPTNLVSGTISVYKSNSTTESTTGVTLTAPFDSVVGLNHVRIDTSQDGTFYADGSQFTCVITVGTVNSVSVVGECIGRFTLRAQASLYPTTAGRKLDVTATGAAGIDWANVEAPTTTVGLSGTTVKTATDVETDTQDIQSRLPAALTGAGNIKADAIAHGGTTQTGRDIGLSVLLSSGTGTGQLDFTSGVVKANLAQILGTALTETAGLLAGGFKKFFNVGSPTGTVNSIPDAVAGASGGLLIAGSNAATTVNITGNITGNLSGSVGSVTGAVGSVTAGVTVTTNNDKTGYGLSSAAVQAVWDALTSALTTVGSIGKLLVDNINATISSRLASASYTAPPSAAANADAVWDEAIAGHLAAGSTGAALSAAGSAGDPWATLLPAAYGAGTAGKIVGDNVNATISSRASSAALATVQADTDDIQTRLPAALVSGRMDSSVGSNLDKTGYALTAVYDAAKTAAQPADVIALLDTELVEVGLTVRQTLRVIAAASAGKLSGAATTTVIIRNAAADSKDRITATVDSNGNRSAVTLDVS